MGSYLRILNSDGFELAANNDRLGPGEDAPAADADGFDSYIRHRFPRAGRYFAGVSNWQHRRYNAETGASALGRAIVRPLIYDAPRGVVMGHGIAGIAENSFLGWIVPEFEDIRNYFGLNSNPRAGVASPGVLPGTPPATPVTLPVPTGTPRPGGTSLQEIQDRLDAIVIGGTRPRPTSFPRPRNTAPRDGLEVFGFDGR